MVEEEQGDNSEDNGGCLVLIAIPIIISLVIGFFVAK